MMNKVGFLSADFIKMKLINVSVHTNAKVQVQWLWMTLNSTFPLLLILQKSLQTLFLERNMREKIRKKEIYLIESLEGRKFVLVLSVMPSFLCEYWSRQREQARSFWVARWVTYN